MNSDIKALIIILILFLVIDLPMITKINYNMYKTQFDRININKYVDNFYYGAIVAYLCLVIGIYYFVVKDNLNKPLVDIAKKGALFGLVIYGIYNGTNKATIAEFGTSEAIKDTLWGIVLCATISVLAVYIINKWI